MNKRTHDEREAHGVAGMSGTRHERRGDRDPEEYVIILRDPKRIAKPLLNENDRETRDGIDAARYLERLGYDVRIDRD